MAPASGLVSLARVVFIFWFFILQKFPCDPSTRVFVENHEELLDPCDYGARRFLVIVRCAMCVR